ncbi:MULTISPECIES: hypothetical protein [Saccharibacillus]|uniref:hypothetical protein n=1 Tax=Saccharibacillus TaxID=456492 RepID=UPI00123945D6|nr:hypothetical protein [Saccharibacillus sp. WB 17]MWJ29733.1 hypothetical protein [Saccharibacillus sp. WB 17]
MIEHEQKPLKLKGKKVIPSLISTLDKDELPLGQYVGVNSNLKVSLINEGGFVNAAPHLRAVYDVINVHPATLGEEATDAKVNEIFRLEKSDAVVSEFSFSRFLHFLKESEIELVKSFWIPGVFKHSKGMNRGWINLSRKEMIFEKDAFNSLVPQEVIFESTYNFNFKRIKLDIYEVVF